jgi:hypothetical protein
MIPLRRGTFQESFKLIENLTEIDGNWKWKQNQRPRFAENPIDHIEASLAIGFLFNTGWCHFLDVHPNRWEATAYPSNGHVKRKMITCIKHV